jgi:phosphocarrier protein HPr
MSGFIEMTEKTFTVKNRLGLHARPAALFVQTTNRFKSSIKVWKGETEVDGKSIMGLMMLAAEEGSKLRIVTNGDDEKDVLAALEALFEKRFDEKE